MTTESQNKRILKRLQNGDAISAMWAVRQLNCFRLAARIHDLRKKHDIKTEIVFYNNKRFAYYSMNVL